MIERTLTLRDGRQLTFAEIGVGPTWLHCHGIPGSRHELSHLEYQLTNQGLRIIIPDRPGYGKSTICQDYSFKRHTEDLAELADHLRLRHFSLSGFSGGGVFALTTAAVLGTRVTEIRLAATPAVPLMPSGCMHAAELTTNAWRSAMEDRSRLASELTPLCEDAKGMSAALRQSSGEPDATYLAAPAVRPYFEQSTVTALSQGATTAAAALARDTALMVHDWETASPTWINPYSCYTAPRTSLCTFHIRRRWRTTCPTPKPESSPKPATMGCSRRSGVNVKPNTPFAY